MTRFLAAASVREQFAKFFRFATVGGLTSAWFALVVFLAVDTLEIKPPIASAIAYLTAIPLSFIGHKRYTFRSRQRWKLELLRFLIVHGINLSISYWSMQIITTWWGQTYWVGIAACVVLVPILTFLLMNQHVFGVATKCDGKPDSKLVKKL